MIELKYIITGTGRCGTVFMAKLLTSLGIPCGHETIFDADSLDQVRIRLSGIYPLALSRISMMEYNPENDDWKNSVDWIDDLSTVVADSSYLAAPFLSEFDAKVVQVVRNPIKVIDSFTNHFNYFEGSEPTNRWEHFIYTHLPEMTNKMPQYDRAALYYVMWNEMIDKRRDFRCKIEQGGMPVKKFLNKRGGLPDQKVNSVVKRYAKKFSPNQIESKEIASLLENKAMQYGYNIRSEYLMI